MDLQAQNVAKKYAIAFLNCFGKNMSLHDADAAQAISRYMHKHSDIMSLIKLPTVLPTTQKEFAKILIKGFSLPEYFMRLFDLLIQQQRLFLIADVLHDVQTNYYRRNNIKIFSIKTSHDISKEQLDDIKKFLIDKTGSRIIGEHENDPQLIAGMRLQSDTLLWEHSIRERLNNVKKVLI